MERSIWGWCPVLTCLAVRYRIAGFCGFFCSLHKLSRKLRVDSVNSRVNVQLKLVFSVGCLLTRVVSRISFGTHVCACAAQSRPTFVVTRGVENRRVVYLRGILGGGIWPLASSWINLWFDSFSSEARNIVRLVNKKKFGNYLVPKGVLRD